MSEVFIIAEAGVNHNGDINLAYKLIDKAVEAGVDAVKFQTFKSEKLVSKKTSKADYQKQNTGKEDSQYEMLKKLELNYEGFEKLKKYCDEKKIKFMSTPFDDDSIEFLDDLIDIYKIPSGEITNYVYLRKVAKKNKPIILSTGMSNLSEVEKALQVIREVNENIKITVLHCTTNYPTPYDEVNLRAMNTIKKAFKVEVGYSDHTLGIEVPIAVVAMGAKVIEKHFTLDKDMEGPDHRASLNPQELKKMVESIRNIEIALGDGIKKPNKSEEEIKDVVRKKIVCSVDLSAKEVLSHKNLEVKRSEVGIKAEYIDIILGKKIMKPKKQGDAILWEDLMNVE